MGDEKPFIPPKVTATCTLLNHIPINSTSHGANIVVYHQLFSQNISTKGSPRKTAKIYPLGGLFGYHQRRDDNSGSSDIGSWTATCEDSWSGKQTNQHYPPHGYSYPPSQQPFPGAPQFYHHSPFNMTHNSSQPTTSVSQQFRSYGPQWQGYDLHLGGYGESQIFPQEQFPGQQPSSAGALRVPPGPPGNNPVNRATSSRSTPQPGPPSGATERPPMSLPTKRLLTLSEPRTTADAEIADLPHLPEISNDDYHADDVSDDSSDLGGAQCKPPVSLKQTKFSLKQFAHRMGQAKYSVFNKWKKVWVAGSLETKYRAIIRGQNHLK